MPDRAVSLAAIAAATAAFALTLALAGAVAGRRGAATARQLVELARQWRILLVSAGVEGRAVAGTGPRLNAAAAAAGAVAGFALLGPVGALLGAAAGAPAAVVLLRARRARYARRVDAGAADLALALASALSAGHSVRGALLNAARALPDPIAGELAIVAVDLTLGMAIEDALAGLRGRTISRRLESLIGAIELHRRSGGDLARLARELADAFRARDAALRDARAATAQARFTALLVGVMPVAAATLAELAWPGSVSGAFGYAPTALLLICALTLFGVGAFLCLKVSRA